MYPFQSGEQCLYLYFTSTKYTVIDYLSYMHQTTHVVRMFYNHLFFIKIPVNGYAFMHTDNNGVDITKVDTVLFLRNYLFNTACLRMS